MRLQTLASVSRTKPDDNVSMNVHAVAVPFASVTPQRRADGNQLRTTAHPCSHHPYAIAALWSTGPVLKWSGWRSGCPVGSPGGRVPGGPGGGGVE